MTSLTIAIRAWTSTLHSSSQLQDLRQLTTHQRHLNRNSSQPLLAIQIWCKNHPKAAPLLSNSNSNYFHKRNRIISDQCPLSSKSYTSNSRAWTSNRLLANKTISASILLSKRTTMLEASPLPWTCCISSISLCSYRHLSLSYPSLRSANSSHLCQRLRWQEGSSQWISDLSCLRNHPS